jgi:hypothetical protein
MCGGAKKAHHAKEEAKREANRQANEFAAQLEAQERANQAMIEALKPGEQKYTPPPMSANAQLSTEGVRRRKAKKTSTLGARRGIAQLRIPLNVGQSSSGGTNVG